MLRTLYTMTTTAFFDPVAIPKRLLHCKPVFCFGKIKRKIAGETCGDQGAST
jgi:hypothetical protein